ncbi:hypothetical protein DXG03_007053 [Asterophora parasitica]|uniref:Uncharacterized protein n=1 Tax=Asterophora parasitica TaxID=117018 RepID=A0A9P7GEC7_9AGAR|nr:hypothetical protein DXG03_007053 [Asterophora parasitica]
MIAGLSKTVALYLTPVLALTAILLSVFAFLSPVIMLHDQVALLTVTPSASSFVQGSSGDVDGANLFLGLLGSCSRATNKAQLNCTGPTLSPVYDLSALPRNAPSLLLSPPSASTPAFIAIALGFSVSFFFTFSLISFRHKMGERVSAALDKPLIQRVSAWIGFFGFLIGLTSFLIIRMWFGKAVQDFNHSIQIQGEQGPKLIATVGNAFTSEMPIILTRPSTNKFKQVAWVAYAFYAIPVIFSMTKLNVKASK